MTDNLDRALEDIIKENRQQRRSRPGASRGNSAPGRRDRQRGSPYSRNNNSNNNNNGGSGGSDRRSGQTIGRGGYGGQWTHDLFDGPASINDRLGVRRQNEGRDSRSKQKRSTERGIAISGRCRDTAPYDALLVVWVSGLPRSFDEEKINDVFRDVGRIDKIRMAVDKNSRFLGSAEITYRLADDARSAIQSFDGETLYGADLANVEPLRVTYSDPEKSMFLDDLKFENSLPTPNDVPMGHRLGLHPVQLAHMQSALQQTYSQSQYAGAYNASRRSQSGGGYNRRQAGNKGSTNEPKSTSEQLDADLDAYMRIDAENENSSSRNSNPGTEAKPDIATEAPAPAPAEE